MPNSFMDREPRRTVAKVRKTASLNLGPHMVIQGRGEFGSAIGYIIHSWAMFDIELTWVLATLLAGNSEAAIAMLSVLRSQTRIQAIERAAATQLAGDDLLTLRALLRLATKLGHERGQVAHAVWATCNEIPKAMLRIPGEVLGRWMAREPKYQGVYWHVDNWVITDGIDLDLVEIFTVDDLAAITRDIAWLQRLIHSFFSPAESAASSRASERRNIRTVPAVAQMIATLQSRA